MKRSLCLLGLALVLLVLSGPASPSMAMSPEQQPVPKQYDNLYDEWYYVYRDQGPVQELEAFAVAPGDVPAALNAAPTYFDDLGAWNSAVPGSAGWEVEDLEESTCGGVCGFDGPLDETGCPSCPPPFSPGDILPGISMNNNGVPRFWELATAAQGAFGSPDDTVVANYFVDSFEMTFDPPVNAVGSRLVSFLGGSSCTVTLWDENDAEIEQVPGSCPPGGAFWGVYHPTGLISRVRVFDGGGGAEGIADAIYGVAIAGGAGGAETDPNRQLGKQVHLPILNFQGQDDVCRTWIEVQNIGSEYKKAILVTWGEPGFCPPQCAGPLKVECSGLLKPGSTWNFLGAQVPTGSKSGILFQFTALQLSDLNIDMGFDDIVADLMCETLFFGVVGDCDDYRRFKKAYEDRSDFAGLVLNDKVKGDGILAVDVLRHCPGDVTPGVEVSSKYNGIAAAHLGSWDPVFGGFGYYAPLLYADKAGFNSVMYIQNGGLECSSVEIWFKAQDDCLRARICEIFTLAPGESYQFDATDCVGPDWQGSAWLRSTQPMGIVVDIIGRDVLMTYIGEPAAYAYVFEPEDPEGFPEIEEFSQGNTVLFGPLMYSEYQGWDSGVQVMNLSPVTAAKVKVYFLDRSGDIITTLVDWICPRGSQTFFLPVVHNLPGNWVGSLRVESQDWWTPGSPQVSAPELVGVATLIKYNDAARSAALEAIAYNLLPEHKIYMWQIRGGEGTIGGVGLIAIPSLLKDLDATGVTSELAIANVVPKPGLTDFVIYIYDQNGLLDFICEKLNEKQVEYIDLQTWGYVHPGFKGSAIISATFWEHDVFSPTGAFVKNLLGLGAVAVERTGTRLGEDVPGDEAAGARGIPFKQDKRMEFGFQGPQAPLCPGLIPTPTPPPAGPPVVECANVGEVVEYTSNPNLYHPVQHDGD